MRINSDRHRPATALGPFGPRRLDLGTLSPQPCLKVRPQLQHLSGDVPEVYPFKAPELSPVNHQVWGSVTQVYYLAHGSAISHLPLCSISREQRFWEAAWDSRWVCSQLMLSTPSRGCSPRGPNTQQNTGDTRQRGPDSWG